MGRGKQVEHVALLIKNTGTCSTCTVSQNHPYVIAGIIIITVMSGFWPGIHVFAAPEDADDRDKPGHDEFSRCSS